MSGAGSAVVGRVPAPPIFVVSALSQYLGAGLAVTLFALMPSTTVAWWRLTVGAVVLVALRRPWRRRWTGRALLAAAVFGAATATMNVVFYAAISLLPLGTAVSLEFLGPVAVAVVTGRGWRPRAAAALALLGVVSISGLGVDPGEPGQRAGVRESSELTAALSAPRRPSREPGPGAQPSTAAASRTTGTKPAVVISTASRPSGLATP